MITPPFLGRSYWGGEYNFEIKRLMLRHAFNGCHQ